MNDPLIAHVYLDTCSGQRFMRDSKIDGPTLNEYLGQVIIDDTNIVAPKPVLPTETGWYASEQDPTIAVFLDINTKWWYGADEWDEPDVVPHLPFTRLAPERPQITRQQIDEIFASAPSEDDALEAILTLVNGTDRD